jgi:WD40 repeat protein/tRNA A-37 threonylcarbamoyl transferase component Bud32
MNTDREELLFRLALTKLPAERAAWLDRECGEDKTLQQKIEAQLIAHGSTIAMPAAPAPEVKATIKLDLTDADDEAVGQTIGRFKLLEKVGEGGCGVVYVAEQSIPVRRRVALKVIKLGMDTKQVVARFEAERQALAMMDHPNIAKALDAGTTETGRPYFVMELVRGIRITDYCDQNQLTTKERLELFIKVCQAIQHAHQKGIIHRDIKPSNILVTLHDGVPVPKVIDFGIAKAIEGRLTDATVYTQLHQFIGTPAYMSPEQAEMSGLDVDTRSDIYSLGVLLYELLTGRTPFDANELMASGIDVMRKTIREKEPVRPSTRFATLQGDDLTTTAKRRSADSAKLVHLLRGDLDWIVMQCLEKDRTRRYETANGLVADIRRHLNNEPIVARPPSTVYRFQKMVRRNKLACAASVAVAAALLLGIFVSTWQAIRATRAKQEAVAAQASESVQREIAEGNEKAAVEARGNEARLREQAEAAELAARQRAYGSDMNVASQAVSENNLGRAIDLLNRQLPAPGQKDLRGWEWRYLWQQTRSDAKFTLCQKPSEIISLAPSPDGKLLAVGDWGKGGLSVWDLQTRQEVIRLAENEEQVRVAFSPAEPLLAYTSSTHSGSGELHYALHLWNTASRQMLAEIPLDGDGCDGLAFSADGHTLATSTDSGLTNQITLWSMPAGTKLASHVTTAAEVGSMATSVAFTPDLSRAAYAAGTTGNQIQVMDLNTGRELWSAPVKSGIVMALAFSPDGKTLASAEGFNETDIRLWDVATGKEMGQLAGHGAWVNSIVFWPDGKTLASSSADQTVRTWDLASRTCLDVLRGHRFGVWRVALLPDGKTLVSGCKDGTVSVWDTSVLHPRQPRITIPENVANWCFATDSQSVVTFSFQGQVTRWSGASFQRSEPIMDLGTNYDPVFYFANVFSRDGRFLANGSANGVIRVWDVANGILLRAITNTASFVVPVKFLADGRRLVTASLTGWAFHEWNLATGRELQSWPAFGTAGDEQFADARDENSFLEFVNGGRMRFRDLTTGQVTETNLDFMGVYHAAFSPDGRSFAVASTFGYARVWDVNSWRELATLKGFLSAANSTVFSPDGRRLAVGSGKQQALTLWDAASWQNVLTLEGQGAGFFNTDFSPDGNAVGSLNVDGNLQIWRAPSWAEIGADEPASARSP